MRIEKPSILQGKQIKLEIIVPAPGLSDQPEIPYNENLVFKYSKYSGSENSTTFIYRLAALKSGTYNIGPIDFVLNGQSYSTNSIVLNVVRDKTKETAVLSEEKNAGDMDISKHIFVELETDNDSVLVNQKGTIKVRLVSDWLDVENITLKEPSSDYMIIEKFGDRKVNIDQRGGTKYVVLEYSAQFYAPTPGDFTIKPIQVKFDVCKAKIKAGAETVDTINDNNAIFEKFLEGAESRTLELLTPERRITVKNKPAIKSEPPKPKQPERPVLIGIKSDLGEITTGETRFTKYFIVFLLLILPLPCVLAAAAFSKTYWRIKDDKFYRALYIAKKNAAVGLGSIEKAMRSGNTELFYENVFRALQQYLGERFFEPANGVTERIVERLDPACVNADVIAMLSNIFKACYLARYGAKGAADEMRFTLDLLKKSISSLNKLERL